MMRITPGLQSPGFFTERRRALDLGDATAPAPFIERRGVQPPPAAASPLSTQDVGAALRSPRNLGRLVERTAPLNRSFDATFINQAGEPAQAEARAAKAVPSAKAGTVPLQATVPPPLVRPPQGRHFDQQALDHPPIQRLDAGAAFDYARALLDHLRRSAAAPTPGSPGAALARDLKAAVAGVARYEHTAFGRVLFNPDEVAQQVQFVMARHAR